MLNKIVKKRVFASSLSKKEIINIIPQSKKRILNSLSTIINIITKINMMSINKKRVQFALTKKIIRIINNVLLFTNNKNLQKISIK